MVVFWRILTNYVLVVIDRLEIALFSTLLKKVVATPEGSLVISSMVSSEAWHLSTFKHTNNLGSKNIFELQLDIAVYRSEMIYLGI